MNGNSPGDDGAGRKSVLKSVRTGCVSVSLEILIEITEDNSRFYFSGASAIV